LQLNAADYSVTARPWCLPYLLLRQYGLSVLPNPEIAFPLQQLSASAVRRRKKTGAGDSLFARLNNTTKLSDITDYKLLIRLLIPTYNFIIVTAPVLLADYVTTGDGLKNGVHCGLR